MREIIYIIAFFVVAAFHNSYAEAPFTCSPVKVKLQNKSMILPGPLKSEDAMLYFFKNSGTEAVWIDHPTRRSMSAGWSSYLLPDHWSVFLLNRKDFLIACSLIKPGTVETLDCTKVLSVCVPKKVVFKTPPKGTYWLVEDKSWDELLKTIDKKGININD